MPEVESKDAGLSTEIYINIESDGSLFYGDRPVNHDQLFNLIKNQLLLTSSDKVIVQADRRVVYDAVIQAVDVAKLAGATNILLVTEHKQQK